MHREIPTAFGGEASGIMHSTGLTDALGPQPQTGLNMEFLGFLQDPR